MVKTALREMMIQICLGALVGVFIFFNKGGVWAKHVFDDRVSSNPGQQTSFLLRFESRLL